MDYDPSTSYTNRWQLELKGKLRKATYTRFNGLKYARLAGFKNATTIDNDQSATWAQRVEKERTSHHRGR